MSEEPLHPLPARGELLAGRYRIEAKIGEGGMGVVYRAAHLQLGRPVALKLLRPELLARPEARARFEREARVAAALDHPSAVMIHDFGEDRGRAFLAMELLSGGSLRALLRASPEGLRAARAIDLSWQIADVLAAAHAMELIHRDLKPENVFVEPAGEEERVRVVDFGLAFIRADRERGRMTREGVVVGTPSYLSPEQARGEGVGPPTDVYALGCLLYELLAGAPPFRGAELEVLTKQMYAPPPSLAGAGRGDLPAALEELLRRALDKRAERRPSAAELRGALGEIDPDPIRARARARDATLLGARALRMVEAPIAAPSSAPADPRPKEELGLGILGEVDSSLLLALAANSIAAFVIAPPAIAGERPDLEGAAALYAPGAAVETIAALAAFGLPVIADAEATDLPRLTALLRAGAADVVARPVAASELARKLERVIGDARRRPGAR